MKIYDIIESKNYCRMLQNAPQSLTDMWKNLTMPSIDNYRYMVGDTRTCLTLTNNAIDSAGSVA
jgi:hypothetical protein